MKQKTFSTLPNKEQALLIGFLTPENMIGERNVSFEELAALAETAGLETVLKTEIKLRDINPATYIGAGKVKELAELGAEFLPALEKHTDVIGREITANLCDRHVRRLFA